ncbi:MAG: hypothetical protein GC193_05255 [Cryomorphaceae bacterium]|nr:hypothetical protein [Cryomorphaceae bacterium]
MSKNNSEQRSQLIATVNTVLTDRHLRPISKLGDSQEGEIEITGILDVFDHSQRFFTDIKFAVIFPGGGEGQFTVRFNANGSASDGSVLVVLLNNLFVIVKQWRLPLGRWTYEFPRGFGEKLEEAYSKSRLDSLKVSDLPLGILSRELGAEVMQKADITSVTFLGNVAENSGTSNVLPSYFLLQLSLPDELPDRGLLNNAATKLYFWDVHQLDVEIGGKLADNHSITAAALALKHIRSLPRL